MSATTSTMSATTSKIHGTSLDRTLPIEILLSIIDQTPHSCLPALALVSRTFNRCVTPRIYRFVHFVETRRYRVAGIYDLARIPDWQGAQFQDLAAPRTICRRDSRIFSVASFLRTITNSSVLRSCIKAASFHWQSKRSALDEVWETIDLLAPSTRNLHVSSPCLIIPPLKMRITSLELRYGLVQDHPTSRDDLYRVFCIPTLQKLTLHHYLGNFSNVPVAENRFHTSTVTSLSLSGSQRDFQNLAEILMWPISLKSFQWSIITEFCPCGVLDILSPQQSSLEEIFITTESNYTDTHENCSIAGNLPHLHNFANIRRLGLAKRCMRITAEDRPSPGNDALTEFPRGLEELQIAIPQMSKCGDYSMSVIPKPPEIEKEMNELSYWLCELAQKKYLLHPSLRRIILWQRRDTTRCLVKGLLQSNPKYPKFDKTPEGFDILSTCKDAGIELYWVVSTEPPLFHTPFNPVGVYHHVSHPGWRWDCGCQVV